MVDLPRLTDDDDNPVKEEKSSLTIPSEINVSAPSDQPHTPETDLSSQSTSDLTADDHTRVTPADSLVVKKTDLGFTQADQIVLSVVAAICLCLATIYCIRLSNWGSENVEIDRHHSKTLEYHLDLNKATWVELSQLKGVGEVLADRIVNHRHENGPFRSIDELEQIKGIGPKTVAKLKKFIKPLN